MRPQSTSLTCTHTHTPSRYSNSRNYQLSLLRSRIDVLKIKIKVYPSLVLFYGTTYLWQWDLVSHSAPSSEDIVHTLKQLHRMDCDIILFGREKQSEVFEWLPLQWHGHLRPTLYTDRTPPSPFDCLWEWFLFLLFFFPCSLLFFIR